MSLAPPLKKQPTWNAATTVPWSANVSGSSSVACWLVGFVYGSELTWVSATFAPATPAAVRNPATASTTARRHLRDSPLIRSSSGSADRLTVYRVLREKSISSPRELLPAV